MPPYGKYLNNNILVNLILYYLITISTLVINISIAFTALINLFRYLINNLFTSDLSDNRIKIAFFFKYNIFIVFTDYSTLFSRLIFVFNSSIKSFSGILSILPYLINISLFEIFIFLIFFFSVGRPFFYIIIY